MGTLYEFLREARLEKYYPTFRANGITRSEALSRLSIYDCTVLGITSTEDQRRLTELINIIKVVQNENRRQADTNQQHTERPVRISSARRQNVPSPSNARRQESPVRGLEVTRDVMVRDRTPNFSAASYVDMLHLLSDSSSEESSNDDGDPDEGNLPRQVARSASANRSSHAPVERVIHTSGYNYGVPKGAQRTKSKPVSSASSRTGEERICVCVRKRPVTRREERAGDDDIVQAEGTNSVIVNEPKQAVDLTAFTLQHEFLFDEVFDENCSNEDVYSRAARPLINSVFNNGSATCFAYGQTGAGKTHTMMGNRDVSGLYLLAAQDIFSIIESKQYGDSLHVWVSFFEIYCGQLFDLLNRRKRLHAREDGSHRVCIAGLMETEAKDVQGLIRVLEYGNSVRSKGATGVNPDSSRSHAILQMEIRDDEDHRLGRISFIDLAGSERAADVTDTDKQTRLEGAEINQSLLALKECIRSIDQSSRHKPFRQSKLTHILKDSFIGNSRTCMIANISPTMSACENTLNTLRYADRVKELKRTGSRGANRSQAERLMMNIPISMPSVFHPSNILSCSTPLRPVTRHTVSRSGAESHLDPTDTPVRGHFPHRKSARPKKSTTSQSGAASNPPLPPESSSSRSVVCHTPPQTHEPVLQHNIPPPATAVTQNSPSGSDRTDSESCNLTLPRNSEQNAVAVHSTDSDCDYPTSDFNVPQELNDLNKTEQSSKNNTKSSTVSVNKSQVQPHKPSKPTGRLLPETPSEPKQAAEMAAAYMRSGCEEGATASSQLVSRPIPRSNSPARRRPRSAAPDLEAGAVARVLPPQVAAPAPAPVKTSDSIEDDLLFAAPDQLPNSEDSSRTGCAAVGPPHPKNNLLTGNQLNVIPAALPASSSDLSFTHRAPVKAPAEMEGLLLTPRSRMPKPEVQTNSNVTVSDVSDPPAADVPVLTAATGQTNTHSPKEPSPPQVLPQRSVSSPGGRRTRHASHSSQSSDDSSIESVRTSQSDSAQGPYKVKTRSKKNKLSDLRKEKSDPMIALHMQTKKKTLPNPEEFHKYLSRGNIPKSSQTSASPMPGPHNKDSPSEGSTNLQNISNESESQTEVKPGQKLNRKSPMLILESRQSPLGHDKDKKDSTSGAKQKSRASVASLIKSFSKADRGSSPKTVLSAQTTSESSSKSSNPGRLDKGTNAQASSKSDSSQQNFTSEVVMSNVQTTTGSFLMRNTSPNNGKTSAVPIVTEKLSAGAMFSPIHPQPITSQAVVKTVSPTGSEVVQPKPVVVTSASVSIPTIAELHSDGTPGDQRSHLISSHEDQLALVTSLCKQEMKLLLSAKSGQRSFDDYMRKLGDLLTHKMSVMQHLQHEISAYCREHGVQPRSVTQSIASNTSQQSFSLMKSTQ